MLDERTAALLALTIEGLSSRDARSAVGGGGSCMAPISVREFLVMEH